MALKSIPPKDKTERNEKYLTYFSCKNRSGKYVTWSSSENNYTLLNFWASWDKASVSVRDSLAKIVKEFPEKKFRVLNISLDYEKRNGLKLVKKTANNGLKSATTKAGAIRLSNRITYINCLQIF